MTRAVAAERVAIVVRHGGARDFRRAFHAGTALLDVKRRAMDAFAIEQSACECYRLFHRAVAVDERQDAAALAESIAADRSPGVVNGVVELDLERVFAERR
jgi:hypothetical protein